MHMPPPFARADAVNPHQQPVQADSSVTMAVDDVRLMVTTLGSKTNFEFRSGAAHSQQAAAPAADDTRDEFGATNDQRTPAPPVAVAAHGIDSMLLHVGVNISSACGRGWCGVVGAR